MSFYKNLNTGIKYLEDLINKSELYHTHDTQFRWSIECDTSYNPHTYIFHFYGCTNCKEIRYRITKRDFSNLCRLFLENNSLYLDVGLGSLLIKDVDGIRVIKRIGSLL